MNCFLFHFLLVDYCFSALSLVLSFWSICPIGYTKKAILGDCLRTCTSSPRDNHLKPRWPAYWSSTEQVNVGLDTPAQCWSCWETPLDHMNHEGKGVLYVLENCRWGQTGNAFQREKCKVGSLFLKTRFASLLKLWSMRHTAAQEFRKGVTDWFLRSSTTFFKYYAVVSFGEKKYFPHC